MFLDFLAGLGLAATGRKPVIGVSGSGSWSASLRAMMTQIKTAGGEPLFLGAHQDRLPRQDIAKLDGLVVMGNDADIDPHLYGQSVHPQTNPESAVPGGAARAAYEREIIKLALEQKMPLLGVCGGMHRLNVLLGGDLHQHIPDLVGHQEHMQNVYGVAPFIPVAEIKIEDGGLLAYVADPLRPVKRLFVEASGVQENSFHHQAVNRLGAGLRAAAYVTERPDGPGGQALRITEALEPDPGGPLKDCFILGVQWHPEFVASDLGPKIARALVGRSQLFALQRPSSMTAREVQEENIRSALDAVKERSDAPPVQSGGSLDDILRMSETWRLASGKDSSVSSPPASGQVNAALVLRLPAPSSRPFAVRASRASLCPEGGVRAVGGSFCAGVRAEGKASYPSSFVERVVAGRSAVAVMR